MGGNLSAATADATRLSEGPPPDDFVSGPVRVKLTADERHGVDDPVAANLGGWEPGQRSGPPGPSQRHVTTKTAPPRHRDQVAGGLLHRSGQGVEPIHRQGPHAIAERGRTRPEGGGYGFRSARGGIECTRQTEIRTHLAQETDGHVPLILGCPPQAGPSRPVKGAQPANEGRRQPDGHEQPAQTISPYPSRSRRRTRSRAEMAEICRICSRSPAR